MLQENLSRLCSGKTVLGDGLIGNNSSADSLKPMGEGKV